MYKNILNIFVAYTLKIFLFILQFMPFRFSRSFMGNFAQFIGKFSKRNKLIYHNLAYAYPNKTKKSIQFIAKNMWWHMGALLSEYFLLNRIVGNKKKIAKNITIENAHILDKIKKEKDKPHIFFTAHIGNFEILAICANNYDVPMSVLFRSPNNKFIAKMLLKIRKKFLANIIPSNYGAAWKLSEELKKNKNIGMLVDQKYHKGLHSLFFNKPVKTNPLAIKLAEKFNCDLYPAICVRTDDGKYKIIIYDKLELIKNSQGLIDIKANTQQLNDIVEQWVQKYPEQWMWFHNRWKI